MATFALILRRLLDTSVNNSDVGRTLGRVLVDVIAWSDCSPASKLRLLVSHVLEARFVEPDVKQRLFDTFARAQRHFFSLHRFRHRWRLRNGERRGCAVDMALNHLGGAPPHITVRLWENNATYTYRISDIITLINKSLLHSSSLFPQPMDPRNPYTNLPFSRASMYIIYNAVQHSTFNMPTLLQLFFSSGFDCDRLLRDHEYYVAALVVDDFILHGAQCEKHEYIKDMFAEFSTVMASLRVHPGFPVHCIVSDLDKHLHVYLKYLTGGRNRGEHKRRVKGMLRRFVRLYPKWGRKIAACSETAADALAQADSPYLPVVPSRAPNVDVHVWCWVDVRCHVMINTRERTPSHSTPRHRRRRPRVRQRHSTDTALT